MKDYIIDIIKIIMAKGFEYFLVLAFALLVWIFANTNTWDTIKDKFGFAEDIKQEVKTRIDELKDTPNIVNGILQED